MHFKSVDNWNTVDMQEFLQDFVKFRNSFCMGPELNNSKTFCVDPRDKPFYIISELLSKTYDYNDENTMKTRYSKTQTIIETKPI